MTRPGSVAALEKLLALGRQNHFFKPKEIGSASGTSYNYGPMGTLLRKNVTKEWWTAMTLKSNMYPVENISTTESGAQNESSRGSSINMAARQDLQDNYLSVLSMNQQNLPLGFMHEQRGSFGEKESCDLFNSSHQKQLCLQYFTSPQVSAQTLHTWHQTRLRWWKRFSNSPSKYTSSETEESPNTNGTNELHIAYEFPWGPTPIEITRNVTDERISKLTEHQSKDYEKMFKGNYNGKFLLPHQIECISILERGVLAYLLDAYTETSSGEYQEQADNSVRLCLHPRLAPYKMAVIARGVESPDMVMQVSGHICRELRECGVDVLMLGVSSFQALQEQVAKCDQMGIPWVTVINDKTVSSGVALVRHITTSLQEQVNIAELPEKLWRFVHAS